MLSQVILWSVPRGGSTAVERSIRELPEVNVLHEPHMNAFSFGPEQPHPNTHKLKDGTPLRFRPAATYKATQSRIVSLARERKHLFIKEISYHVAHKYRDYVEGDFAQFKHTFLIRKPLKVVLSLYKALQNSQFQWGFNPAEIGFEELYNLYETVRGSIDPNPLVIDSDDLFNQPRFAIHILSTFLQCHIPNTRQSLEKVKKVHEIFLHILE